MDALCYMQQPPSPHCGMISGSVGEPAPNSEPQLIREGFATMHPWFDVNVDVAVDVVWTVDGVAVSGQGSRLTLY